MKILVYARPWNKEQFFDLASKVWPDEEIIVSSEHPSIDQSGIYAGFYKAVNTATNNQYHSKLSEAEIEDVIVRCRLLRSIDRSLAKMLVFSMEQAVEQVLSTHAPSYVLSITVDSYILHLLSLLCERKGIIFIGLIPTFLKGTFRITVLGEKVLMREVAIQECEAALSELTNDDYKPSFVSLNRNIQHKKAIKLWQKNLIKPVWFRLKRFLTRDIYNYHYLQAQVISEKYWSLLPKAPIGVNIQSASDVKEYNDGRQMLFLPLQMSPEATIDYWSKDKSWIEYELKVFQLIDLLGARYDILVKEHPNVVGYRESSFYKKLKKYQEKGLCRQVDPYLNSNIVLDVVDGVLLCTGSIGFEAVIRGIPVYSDSAPFYLDANHIYPISQLVEVGIASKRLLTKNECMDIIHGLLESVSDGVFINDGTWRLDCADQNDIALGIKKYINSI